MNIYQIKTTWGDKVHFAADLSQASAPICDVDDDTLEFGRSTQYQTADARHNLDEAARLYMSTLGRDFYADPSTDQDDDEAIEAAIESVEEIIATPN